MFYRKNTQTIIYLCPFMGAETLCMTYARADLGLKLMGLNVYSGGGSNAFTVRDPSLKPTLWLGKFWIAYTQSTFNGGAFTPGKTFGLASSTDLLNWTWVADIDVSSAVGAGTYYTWQPCWLLDDNDDTPRVCFVSSVPNSGALPGGDDSQTYETHCLGSDPTQWSTPVPMANLLGAFIPQNWWRDSVTGKYNAEGFGASPWKSDAMLGPYSQVSVPGWTTLGAGTDGFSVSPEGDGNLLAFQNVNSSPGDILPFSRSLDSGATWSVVTPLGGTNFQHYIANPSLRLIRDPATLAAVKGILGLA